MYTPLDQLLQGKTIVDTELTTFQEAIEHLIANNVDGVSYQVTRQFVVNNIGVLEKVADNKVKFEVPISRDADLVAEVSSNLPTRVFVNNLGALPDDKIILIAAQYAACKVVVYLDSEHYPDSFYVTYKAFILESNLRHVISTTPGISSGSLAYANGSSFRVL
jgi:hypothetical protein